MNHFARCYCCCFVFAISRYSNWSMSQGASIRASLWYKIHRDIYVYIHAYIYASVYIARVHTPKVTIERMLLHCIYRKQYIQLQYVFYGMEICSLAREHEHTKKEKKKQKLSFFGFELVLYSVCASGTSTEWMSMWMCRGQLKHTQHICRFSN